MKVLGASDEELSLAVYDGVFEAPLWGTFLERLRVQARVPYAGLIFRPVHNAPLVHLFAGTQFPPHIQQVFTERFGVDPLPHRAMREGRVYALSEIIDSEDPAQRSFYEEVLAPGGARYARSVRVTEQSGVDAWLTLTDAKELSATAGSLLSRIVPHLRTALRSYVALERERLRSAISAGAIVRLSFGWLTLDARCRILDETMNIKAVLQRTNLVRRDRYDRLTFASSALDREIGALVRDFAQNKNCRPRAFNLSHDPWMDALVTPVPEGAASPGSNAAAIVYLSGDHWSRNDRCEQLVDLFGLLPSEARLAWAMAQGRSIAQAANELGLTLETARNYSKKIYSKTGASGQAALVRIIFTSVLAIV